MKRLKLLETRKIPFTPLIIIAGLAVIGVIIAVVSHAAGSFMALEPENGIVGSPAVVATDVVASGGKSISFKAAAPSPAPTPTPSPTPTTGCINPIFTTSNTNGGWSSGGYYVHNNMWNASSGETLYACAYNNWYVEASGYSGTSVKTYPNVHKDINDLNGSPFGNYSTIGTTFAGRGPGAGIYDVAYDLWLNGVGWGGGTTEVMIWTEYITQVPLGSIKSTYTAGGITYDVWHYNDGNANVVSYVARGNQYSGAIDLKALLNFGISKSYIPANPSVNQIGYGIEFCSTNGTKQRFTVSGFSVTMQ